MDLAIASISVGGMPLPSSMTVIVLFHNLGAMADDALRSLTASIDPRIHYLLIDDASTDGTTEKVQRAAIAMPRTEALLLHHNRGPAAARNLGMSRVRTSHFTFLDGDDWVADGYYPALFDSVLATGLDWVRTDHILCTGTERIVGRIPDGNRAGRIGRPRDSILPGARTTSVDMAHSWSGVYHRRLYEAGFMHFPESLRSAEDRPFIWELHLNVEAFTISDVVGLHYRRGLTDSLTQTRSDSQLAITESMRRVRDIVAADHEADRFMPKVVRTWAGLLAWHWTYRARLASPVRRRFILEAADLLDEADPELLAEVLRAMPESRRQAVGALRRQGELMRTRSEMWGGSIPDRFSLGLRGARRRKGPDESVAAAEPVLVEEAEERHTAPEPEDEVFNEDTVPLTEAELFDEELSDGEYGREAQFEDSRSSRSQAHFDRAQFDREPRDDASAEEAAPARNAASFRDAGAGFEDYEDTGSIEIAWLARRGGDASDAGREDTANLEPTRPLDRRELGFDDSDHLGTDHSVPIRLTDPIENTGPIAGAAGLQTGDMVIGEDVTEDSIALAEALGLRPPRGRNDPRRRNGDQR